MMQVIDLHFKVKELTLNRLQLWLSQSWVQMSLKI